MSEDKPTPQTQAGHQDDDLFRVFLSRYDEGGKGGKGPKSHQRTSDFFPLLFEEIEAVSHSLATLDEALAQALASVKHREQRKVDQLRDELHRVRTRLRQIAHSLTTAPHEPQVWDLAAMFRESIGLLAGEMRARHIKATINAARDIPPLVLHHPRPGQALFAMLQGMVESGAVSEGRIVVQLSQVGKRTFAELFVHHKEGVLDRKSIPLASLLPLSVTDGVRLDWEATPGRFALRMEFAGSAEEEQNHAESTSSADPAQNSSTEK